MIFGRQKYMNNNQVNFLLVQDEQTDEQLGWVCDGIFVCMKLSLYSISCFLKGLQLGLVQIQLRILGTQLWQSKNFESCVKVCQFSNVSLADKFSFQSRIQE
eukprot:TRINITY_DN23558_c0_g1_i14.p3 TRINITY_DN23558_c0_g1~~TRINITY_DN23558_c0_g1_i14.p3  ORF type:complete len:102 (+),score=6.05 TRINITY_DN23558_c0_g1_i14:38-343(+)